MFNSTHISYMVISGIITIALLLLLARFCKTEKSKKNSILFFAIITVIIHYSSLWVDFFTTGTATVDPTMLLPLYPCNICMWLLLITASVKKSDRFVYKTMAEFTFWAGCVCGFIGILLNEQYAYNPTLQDYHILKGLLSHSTMIVGAALLGALGYVKIRMRNVLSVALGLAMFIVVGTCMNALFAHFELPPCNSMFLLGTPYGDNSWLTTKTVGALALAVAFLLCALYEQIFLPKEERWYRLLGNKLRSRRRS